MTHSDLVKIAYCWILKNGKCGIAFKELNTHACNGEYPDVIGFSSWGHSFLIECKNSRSDFLSDRKKVFRKEPSQGMGSYRYYCCPKGLISVEELPEGWGLIYVDENNKPRTVHQPIIKTPGENGYTHKEHFRHEKNIKAEHGLMYSALRRLFIKGHVKHIYDKQYNKNTTADELITLNEYQ